MCTVIILNALHAINFPQRGLERGTKRSGHVPAVSGVWGEGSSRPDAAGRGSLTHTGSWGLQCHFAPVVSRHLSVCRCVCQITWALFLGEVAVPALVKEAEWNAQILCSSSPWPLVQSSC